ncbi:hypothetical protein GCM10020254_37150 [Streptomyces goshikiensis]
MHPTPDPGSGPGSGPEPVPAPDDLVRRHAPGTRLIYRARQRSVDATAWLGLVLHLPVLLLGLGLVLALSLLLDAWLGLPAWLPALLWLASGALVFNRTVEDRLARHLLRLHRPLPPRARRPGPGLARGHRPARGSTAAATSCGSRTAGTSTPSPPPGTSSA